MNHRKQSLLLLFIAVLCLGSCKTAKENKTNILGSWTTIQWLIDENENERSNQMDFSFQENDRYLVDYGTEKEVGKYWFEANDLFTIEDGKAMKKVSIRFIGHDTMVMKMNRAGQKETVTLLRSN